MRPASNGPGRALFERLFGRAPADPSEEERLRHLFRLLESASTASGPEFLPALATHLTQLLGVDYCVISRVDPRDPSRIRALGFARRGRPLPEQEFVVDDRPCGVVMQGQELHCPTELPRSFPKDHFLVQEGLVSYFGQPLWSADGEVLGGLCLLDSKPMEEVGLARELVAMFAGRAASEVERIRAREHAQASDQILRNFAAEFPGWVCAHESSADGSRRRLLYSNGYGRRLIGPRNFEMVRENGLLFNRLLHPEERVRVEAAYERARQAGDSYELEYRLRHDDGSYRWVQTLGRFSTDPIGNSISHSVMVDREALHRLRERNDRLIGELRTVVAAIPDGIVLQDEQGRVRFLNASAEQVLGVPASALAGRDLAQAAEAVPRLRDLFNRAHRRSMRVLSSGERMDTTARRQLREEEQEREFETSWIPQRDGDGRVVGLLTVFRDVTERNRARRQEEQMRELQVQADRLQALSRLVDGVAHEFENQLTAILGFTDLGLARWRQAADSADREFSLRSFERIRGAAQAAHELASSLLAFGQRSGAAPACEVERVLEGEAARFAARCGTSRRFEVQIEAPAPGLGAAMDAARLAAVVDQLLENAFEAGGLGGRIQLQAEPMPTAAAAGLEYRIQVTDDGVGIPSAILDRVFDPLFSTRSGRARRRGMGLAVAQSQVLQAGGRILVQSRPGEGACFALHLPLAPLETRAVAEEPLAPEVLVIEDNTAARELIEEVLRAGGHRVHAVAGPAELREWMRDGSAAPALAVIDVHLQHSQGSDLVEELRSLWPQLVILYCSGLPPEMLEARGADLSAAQAVLTKPFRPTELLATVQEALARPPALAPPR